MPIYFIFFKQIIDFNLVNKQENLEKICLDDTTSYYHIYIV